MNPRKLDLGLSSAGASVQPHLRVLRALGFCHLDPPAPPARPALRGRLHAAYHVFVTCVTSTYALQQLAYAYQEIGDMDKLSGVLFVLLCHVTCIAKQLALHAHASRFDELVTGLDDPLFNVRRAEATRLRAQTTRDAARLLRAYAGCAQATCVLWSAFAAVDRMRGAPVEFAFWTGFGYERPLVFAAVLSYSFCTTSLVAVGNTTMDAFAVTVLHQCRTQLAILRCCSLIERVFSAALLVQFAAGGWILCMAAYKIVSLNVMSIEFASTTLFIGCILTELLLFCYFGNDVTVESELVGASLYGMLWPALSPRFRRALLLAMTRAARPLRPAAGSVLPLSLPTFLTERADMDKLARVMFLLLCHVTSIAKQLAFYRDAARIDAFIAGLDDPLYSGLAAGAAGAALLARGARGAARFARGYSAAAVLTCSLWITFPVLDRLRGRPVEFPFWVPLDCIETLRFTLVLLYSFYVTTLVGIANTTMDAFIATVLEQFKMQLTILRMGFESLPERAAAAAAAAGGAGGEARDAALGALFRESLAHYDKIARDIILLQDIFSNAVLIQFGIGGFILCMAAYKIVSLSILSIEFASMTLFICCILTELFLYCFYGNEVTVESERLVQSMYCMEWVGLPAGVRRALVTAMEGAKRPLRPAAGAGHVVPLSLDTFIKIIKFSYSFYAVLRQTK